MRARAGRALLLLAPAAFLLGLDRPAGLADVAEVRHWSYPDYTRVVVELSGPVEGSRVGRLPADPAAGRPERLYLDLDDVWVGLRYAEPIPVRDGLLQQIRLGQNTKRRTRLVIDLQHYDHHRVFTLRGPDRLVVDVYGGPGAEPGPAPPERAPALLPVGLRPVHTVVVDAGHGGGDPGAIGRGGLREKDVTLAIALELRKRLIERGFRVVMTREGDDTRSLEERTAIAEGSGGDVFVSIHANAAPRPTAHGIETYYLDQSNERHTLRVAARESGVLPRDLDPLQRTMAELRVSEVSVHSRRLAMLVQDGVVQGVEQVFGSARNLGAKRGPFHVLFLSSSPSVLVEVGFLTHPREARRLTSPLYRAVVAERIARALSRYRGLHEPPRLAGTVP